MNATTRLVALAGSLLMLSACSDGSGPATPSALAASGTLAPSAAVGSVVTPMVVVKDGSGRSVSGVPVTFAVTSGGGAVASTSATTNASGVASAGGWTLGTTTGTNTLVASSGTLPPVTFTVNAIAGAPATITPLGTNVATGIPGMTLNPGPGVTVRDQYGNAAAGAEVLFSVSSVASGTVTGISQQTDASGVARPTSWTLGAAGGVQTLTARVGALSADINVEVTIPSAVIGTFAGHNTTCPAGAASCTFTVAVVTNAQQPGAGQSVQWLNGTGSVLGTTTTNIRGFSSFTLPAAAVTGSGIVRAQLESTGQQVSFNYSVVQGGQFNIDVRFIGNATPSQEAVFRQAANRWQQVIIGDLPNVAMNIPADSLCASEFPNPALNETVDDILILIEVDSIDGVGQVLGRAGPCRIRVSSSLPVAGIMQLDEADVDNMEAQGRLFDVVLHEMGHVLGLGSQIYAMHGLYAPGVNPPTFTGARAYPGFILAGGPAGTGVPLEDCVNAPQGCGAGTIYSHWKESVFKNELMTGYISATANPLSTVTVGALMDLGYQVNFAAANEYCLDGFLGAPLCIPSGGSFMEHLGLREAAAELRELPMPAPVFVPGS